MTERKFEFQYNGSEPGFCTTYFKRCVILKDGAEHTFHYALIDEGLYTATPMPWREPNARILKKALPRCYLERVPNDDPTAEFANQWIENFTGGFLPDDHVFTRIDLRDNAA